MGGARILIGHYIIQPRHIALCCAQFLLGILAPHMQAGNACRFLQHLPPFGGLGRDGCGNAPLAHQCRGMRAGCGIGENQRNILGPYIAAIGAVSRTGIAFYAPHNFQLRVIIIAGQFLPAHNGFARGIEQMDNLTRLPLREQGNFGKIACGAALCSGKNHIRHAAAAHGFGGIFPHNPAYGFQQIGLAAAIGTDDTG